MDPDLEREFCFESLLKQELLHVLVDPMLMIVV